MKFVDIFAEELDYREQLFSVVYPNKKGNYGSSEYEKLLDLWTNVEYLRHYAKTNNVKHINDFVRKRLRDAEKIEDFIDDILESGEPLDRYFHQLNNNETGVKVLSLRKGKTSKKDGLRLYAIKIDTNCFLITGGAIKMSLKNNDHPGTREEMKKIENVKSYLQSKGIIDEDSFYELLIDMENEK